MRLISKCILCALLVLSASGLSLSAESSWASRAFSIFKSTPERAVTESIFEDANQLAKALREALAVSAERALADLGSRGGFADSERYRIPLPKAVESFRKPLSLVNQEGRLDAFQATMNRAAEAGVAAAPSVVKKTIQSLTLKDLNSLWKGEDDAITRFLEKNSREHLAAQMLPLIAQATDSTGATRSYKAIQSSVPESDGGLFSAVKSLTGFSASDFDLDQYVNDHALDALFSAMAVEEKALRENPVARSTDLLKKLFGQ